MSWGYDDTRRAACVAEFGNWHTPDLWKHGDDLRRYDSIIADTRPDIIVETGTNTGASALWLATGRQFGVGHPFVITIDVDGSRWNRAGQSWAGSVMRLGGTSTDLHMVEYIKDVIRVEVPVERRPRVMVSLDSDHSAAHVLREIELYSRLVTPGCYLVIEDGILSWLSDSQLRAHACTTYDGTPLDAIESAVRSGMLTQFTADTELEFRYPVTMSPGGWWRRDA